MKTLAIIVNYYSCSLTEKAVSSVIDSESLGDVEIVVVDNSADSKEADCLRSNLNQRCKIVVPSSNVGFGSACNLALKRSSCDLVLLINPDAFLLPGALVRMQQTLLSHPLAGAVGPQVFWDRGCEYFLPPSYPPELFLWYPIVSSWGLKSPVYSMISYLWRAMAVKVWKSSKPVPVPALSGGHMLIRKIALDRVGGLFDPAFFMYFEDADLCMRLRKNGYRLLIEPRAEVVHSYDSCGGYDCRSDKLFWMNESKIVFVEKHTGWKLSMLRKHFLKKQNFIQKDNEVRLFSAPFEVEIPRKIHDGWLFEWSPNFDFIPAAGKFGCGPVLSFSQDKWNMQGSGKYYGRIGNPGVFPGKYMFFYWEK